LRGRIPTGRLHRTPHLRDAGAEERNRDAQIVLDAEAGQVSAELARRGVPPHARVHVQVEVTPDGELPMAAIAQAGTGRDRLAEESELYSDADLIEPAR
jgi:hypothetical protein